MDIIASVAMNDGRPARTTSKAVVDPHAAPTAIAPSMAAHIGRPRTCSSQLMTMIATASTAPTDRSMPPMRITSVMPSAMMPSTVT
ncbi:hypothetical protein D9M71_558740 [compost metagenome]